ncbi:hypothetical protein E2C01_065357 [Portunus trituberculatus]|uniref:Uncharacterized protein n=1 Tax=Portunus trituberculatus TaxID=210409 RepID=A0A5B7HMT0_PORTR|nr:hypothetical protein [Portunus trituberculatus]
MQEEIGHPLHGLVWSSPYCSRRFLQLTQLSRWTKGQTY